MDVRRGFGVSEELELKPLASSDQIILTPLARFADPTREIRSAVIVIYIHVPVM